MKSTMDILAILLLIVLFTVGRSQKWGRPLVLVLLLGLISAIYVCNPFHRIFSFHGLWHTAISYHFFNGQLPLENPFMAGMPMGYYWGCHWFAAILMKFFLIPPSWAFAGINLTAAVISAGVLYKISSLLIHDHFSNVLSAFMALFGTSILAPDLQWLLRNKYHFSPEHHGTPLLNKFYNINSMPCGVACFLVLLYGVCLLIEKKQNLRGLILVEGGFLGLLFFYPPLLPYALVFIGGFLVVNTVAYLSRGPLTRSRDALVLLALTPINAGLLWFYKEITLSKTAAGHWLQISADIPYTKLLNCCLYMLPMIFVCVCFYRCIKPRMQYKTVILLLAAGILAVFMYLFMDMKGREYKYFILANMLLGLFLGITMANISRHLSFLLAFLLVMFFTLDGYADWKAKVTAPPVTLQVREARNQLLIDHEEQNDFYQWIIQKTEPQAVFVDLSPYLPVFAQRSNYYFRDTAGLPGFISEFLSSVCQLDEEEMGLRQEIVHKLYRFEPLTPQEEKNLKNLQRPIYLVLRGAQYQEMFAKRFRKVYSSKDGNIILYKIF